VLFDVVLLRLFDLYSIGDYVLYKTSSYTGTEVSDVVAVVVHGYGLFSRPVMRPNISVLVLHLLFWPAAYYTNL